MGHSDACKIQVTQFVKKLTEKGLSVNEACKEAERESDGIPAETIRYWWKQIQKETAKIVGENSPTTPTSLTDSDNREKQVKHETVTPQDHSETPKKGGKQVLRDEKGHFAKGTTPPLSPGRHPKHKPSAVLINRNSDAMYFATIAISQLERIMPDDPDRVEALQKVKEWIDENM